MADATNGDVEVAPSPAPVSPRTTGNVHQRTYADDEKMPGPVGIASAMLTGKVALVTGSGLPPSPSSQAPTWEPSF